MNDLHTLRLSLEIILGVVAMLLVAILLLDAKLHRKLTVGG